MKIIREFKAFLSRGNVIDMAVGIIVGGAFTAIVNSLVTDLINPLLGVLTGGIDFSALSIKLGQGEDAPAFAYGSFLSAVINFLLVALVLFLLIKALNRFHKKKEESAPAVKTCPFCKTEIPLEASRCPHCTSQLEPEQEV